MRRRLLVLVPVMFTVALAGACGGGESDTPEAAGGARITIDAPRDAALHAVAEVYRLALEKAGVEAVLSAEGADLSFDATYKGEVLDAVTPRIRAGAATRAVEAEIDRVERALSSEELGEIQEQTDPQEEDHIEPTAAAERWIGLNGF